MKVIFTNHAKQRMIEREINNEQITETINFPDYTLRKDNKIEAFKKINNKILKIIYVEKSNFIKIITLIWK